MSEWKQALLIWGFVIAGIWLTSPRQDKPKTAPISIGGWEITPGVNLNKEPIP